MPARRIWFAREPDWQFSWMLGLEVLFLFVAVPAFSAGRLNRDAVMVLQFGLAVTVIVLIAKSAWLRLGLAASFGLAGLARLLPGLLPQASTLTMAFGYNALVTLVTGRAVFGPGDINHHRIAGAVFVYLNIALLFALAYGGLVLARPEAITGLGGSGPNHFADMLHLSITQLTSIGDGEVVVRSPFARSLADLETICGQLFPAILLSRLVGLHLHLSRSR